MSTGRRFGVSRTHVEDGHTVVDEAHVMDSATLVETARRVCARNHLHDTAEFARACDVLPGPEGVTRA